MGVHGLVVLFAIAQVAAPQRAADAVKRAALDARARNGDAAARAALEQAGTIDADATLASLGDAKAIARLRAQLAQPAPGVDQVGAIDALVQARAIDAAPDLIAA